jgi:transposase InsO family protein
MKYTCIARHRGEFAVRLMCRVLEVSPSGFYASVDRPPSARSQRDRQLTVHIRVAHERSGETYGAPRVLEELKADGELVGQKRVARLMREDGLVARPTRRFVVTTDSNHAHPIAPNLLARRFDVNGVHAVNRVWIGDITYLPTREGFLYLAVLLDLASRRVVGWSMQDTLEAELTLAALRMAVERRRPAPGLLPHSDRGSQYACGDYRDVLTAHGMVASMSRRGDCWDNAVAESFFSTLEFELIAKSDWATRDEARRAVFRYLETWYNRERRHSTLGYRSPLTYEREVLKAAA